MWAGLTTSVMTVVFALGGTYLLYVRVLDQQLPVKRENSFSNFIFRPTIALIHPTALPWFPQWSAGTGSV